MSYYKRKDILTKEYDVSWEDFEKAKKDVNKTKFLREVTMHTLPARKLEEALESAIRKTKRLLHRNH